MSLPKISFSIADLPININIEYLFEFAQKNNVDGIEIVLGYKTFPGIKRLSKFSNHYNTPILSIHSPLLFGKLIYPIEEIFQMAQFFRAKLIIHPLKGQNVNSQNQKNYLLKMSQLQKKYEVEVLLENLSPRSSLPIYKYFSKADVSTTNIVNIYKLSKKYHFGITFDTSHFNNPSIHKSKDFKIIFPYIKNIHLSDFKKKNQHLALGEGCLDVEKFLRFLKKYKYCNLITLELSPHLYYSFNKYRIDLSDSINRMRKLWKD